MKFNNPTKVGQTVRLITSKKQLGDIDYVVTSIDKQHCEMREINPYRPEMVYASQPFVVSLLHVVKEA